MKISDSYKMVINNIFRHTIFDDHSEKTILKILQLNVRGSSNVTFIPPCNRIEVQNIDQTHDRLVFHFDDYQVDGVVEWLPKEDGKHVFLNYK